MGSSSPSYSRGEHVPVLYSPTDHSDAIIDEGWMNWLGLVILLLVGIMFGLLSFTTLKKQAKKRREAAVDSLRLDI